jgi:hypothetical protein
MYTRYIAHCSTAGEESNPAPLHVLCPLPPSPGLIIINAHHVSETSGEGFAVRLYRQGPTPGFDPTSPAGNLKVRSGATRCYCVSASHNLCVVAVILPSATCTMKLLCCACLGCVADHGFLRAFSNNPNAFDQCRTLYLSYPRCAVLM